MKVHYINILLFAVPLNILINDQRNHKSILQHIRTTRLLCECEVYASANYDSDPEMKKVMEQFEDRTSERFHEYDERMKTTRQKCKEKCDKEIEKIILKDKLEKELTEKFATLHTDIQSDAIPTCVCEKSLADKVEKGCLRCGGVLGGGIAPSWGLVCGAGYAGWKTAATTAAMEYAIKKGIEEGVKTVIAQIKDKSLFGMALKGVDWSKYITESYYSTVDGLVKAVKNAIDSYDKTWASSHPGTISHMLETLSKGEAKFVEYVAAGQDAAAAETKIVETAKLGKVATQSTQLYNAIGYSVLVIVIIILVMLIIYLILRYRRKKKMKKKLQYIKLLEE
ncbi:rifin [Plasmodium reichenowi]|uniref:Rifin n=1 Tax=Plasmodium reichenowi TaxID=5854 RepID=A0A060RLX1_PLARE|nr:rifin [Plasmodium reichenowi]